MVALVSDGRLVKAFFLCDRERLPFCLFLEMTPCSWTHKALPDVAFLHYSQYQVIAPSLLLNVA